MFKRLDAAWRARTPTYLHNGTKENFIWQLKLLALFIIFMYGKDWWEDREFRRRLKEAKKQDTIVNK